MTGDEHRAFGSYEMPFTSRLLCFYFHLVCDRQFLTLLVFSPTLSCDSTGGVLHRSVIVSAAEHTPPDYEEQAGGGSERKIPLYESVYMKLKHGSPGN